MTTGVVGPLFPSLDIPRAITLAPPVSPHSSLRSAARPTGLLTIKPVNLAHIDAEIVNLRGQLTKGTRLYAVVCIIVLVAVGIVCWQGNSEGYYIGSGVIGGGVWMTSSLIYKSYRGELLESITAKTIERISAKEKTKALAQAEVKTRECRMAEKRKNEKELKKKAESMSPQPLQQLVILTSFQPAPILVQEEV